jgi:predicted nucleotidyltransferase component of viral defense system
MRPFAEQIEILVSQGYGQAAAQAKVAHDAVLLAMDVCGFKKHSTIKGGIVMSHVTNDIRRTTMDMDIAFVQRSISDVSIVRFVRKLNCLPKVRISMFGTIGELLHEDYRGKRLYLDVTDGSISTPIRMKLDIGVHTHKEIEQIDFSFSLADGMSSADLLANPNEQIFAEKLLSLLRHRRLSRRPKDIFDLCYLCDFVDVTKLRVCIDSLIYSNRRIQPTNKAEIVSVLKDVFASRQFMRRLASARANWLQIEPDKATSTIIRFLETL